MERLWVLIIEGHFMLRHQSEDGTKIEQAFSACGRQHLYNTRSAKVLLLVLIRDQLYSHVALITLHCHYAIPQYQVSAALSLLCICDCIHWDKLLNLLSAKAKSLIWFSALQLFSLEAVKNRGAKTCCFLLLLLVVLVQHLLLGHIATKSGETWKTLQSFHMHESHQKNLFMYTCFVIDNEW